MFKKNIFKFNNKINERNIIKNNYLDKRIKLKYIDKNFLINLNNNVFILLFIIKFIFFLIIIVKIININQIYKNDKIQINKNYLKIKQTLNLKFNINLKKRIILALYAYCIKNGGRARITSILINHFYKLNIFKIYLFTRRLKENNEYIIPKNIKRVLIQNDIIPIIIKKKINILIYHLYYENEILKMNNLKNVKVIYYLHTCSFYWLYANFNSFKTIYKSYIKSKYVISLIPFENDYLFKKWGINSILMYNFITYEYKNVVPSNLNAPNILLIGRGDNKYKRFELGIFAMEYIINQVPKCELKIISNITGTDDLFFLMNNINLEKSIKFVGYSSIPEKYFTEASIHIFPTISESFGLALAETKLFGIPNILVGLDYVLIAEEGTVIVYDDTPEQIAYESILILKNINYKKNLGKLARKSMKSFNNDLLYKRWDNLILSIFNSDKDYFNMKAIDKKISEKKFVNILKNQINLLKIRDIKFRNITLNNFKNFTYMESLNF